jgi:hypothetical protein
MTNGINCGGNGLQMGTQSGKVIQDLRQREPTFLEKQGARWLVDGLAVSRGKELEHVPGAQSRETLTTVLCLGHHRICTRYRFLHPSYRIRNKYLSCERGLEKWAGERSHNHFLDPAN